MESDADEENVNRKRKNDLEADERVNWKKCIICRTNVLNLLPALFDIVLRIPQNVAPKIYERNVSSTSFRRIYTVNG